MLKFIRIAISSLIILQVNQVYSQDLSSHKWKDRLLIVNVANKNSALYKAQIAEFNQNIKGLEERKLVLYHFKGNEYKVGWELKSEWKQRGKNGRKYQKSTSDFEVLLIGLDGGIKLRQNELLKSQKLFSIIDAMPMRIQEMRNKKNH